MNAVSGPLKIEVSGLQSRVLLFSLPISNIHLEQSDSKVQVHQSFSSISKSTSTFHYHFNTYYLPTPSTSLATLSTRTSACHHNAAHPAWVLIPTSVSSAHASSAPHRTIPIISHTYTAHGTAGSAHGPNHSHLNLPLTLTSLLHTLQHQIPRLTSTMSRTLRHQSLRSIPSIQRPLTPSSPTNPLIG